MGVVSRSQRPLCDVAVSGLLVPAWNTSNYHVGPHPAGIFQVAQVSGKFSQQSTSFRVPVFVDLLGFLYPKRSNNLDLLGFL